MTEGVVAPEIVRVKRVMTPKEANVFVGTKVPDLQATVQKEVIAFDDETGEPVFAYLDLGDAAESLRKAVLAFEYTGTTARAGGFENQSRTFGYAPRRPVYGREGCKPASLVNEAPLDHVVVEQWADVLAERLSQIDPRLLETGKEETQVVKQDWLLGEESFWTSGVINQSSRLPYHRDGFNFHAWSAMPVFRRNMKGGFLSIPEYDTVIPCRDRWALFFPGWQLVHGNTAMKPTKPGGYRYSVVYYALKGMKNCFEAAMETQYALERRTERERDMARKLKDGVVEFRSEDLKKKTSGRLIGGLSGDDFND